LRYFNVRLGKALNAATLRTTHKPHKVAAYRCCKR